MVATVVKAGPHKRRTQAERREEMRAKLAKAAFDVVAKKGHSAFRTAAVAAQAGVSQGAQVHHFATKDDLTLAALEYAFTEASKASARRVASIPRDVNPLPYLLTDLSEFFLGKYYWVSLDIVMDGSKNRTMASRIREIAAAYRIPIYTKWAQILVDFGWPANDAEEIVRLAAATLAGMGMRSLWENIDDHLEKVLWRMEQIILTTWPAPPIATTGTAPPSPVSDQAAEIARRESRSR
jgi:AcrR family transcriptional regulator